MTSIDPLTSLSSIRAELDNGWSLFDQAWKPFGAREWSRKFGRTWTYAEQPYHLAYFDGLLAKYFALGATVAEADRFHMRTFGEINEWNRVEFAKRKPG